MEIELKGKIIAFAQQLVPHDEIEAAVARAIDCAWLDTSGRPTDEGKDLIAALEGQRDTRSVFRSAA